MSTIEIKSEYPYNLKGGIFMLLLVDDTDYIRKLIKEILKGENIEVHEAVNGQQAIEKVLTEKYDLILMDIMMPVLNGTEATKKIRRITETPIIFLTALSDEKSQVTAYDYGADGYIVKPFSKEVIKSVVKRYVFKSGLSKKYGALEINKKSGKVINNGEELKLSIKEREILFYLEENKGLVKTREDILLSVWGYDFDGIDRVIDKQITKLRSKLGDSSRYIKTVKSIGYKFEDR